MNKLEYQAYLLGDHWKNFKLEFYKVNKKECSKCGSTTKLNLHHLTYERLGKERLSDVVCLCEICHHDLHKKMDGIKLPKKRKKRKKVVKKYSCTNCKFFVFGYYCNKLNKSAPYGYRTNCKRYKKK